MSTESRDEKEERKHNTYEPNDVSFHHRIPRSSVVKHRRAESEGFVFYSSLRNQLFSLSQAREKTCNMFINS